MPINNHIEDPQTGRKARVVDGIEPHGLVVATRQLKEYNNITKFFLTEEGSPDMNIDGGTGGTPDQIHNGGDTLLWTGTAIVGANWDFADLTQNHTPAGTASVSFLAGDTGDLAQFAKGSSLDLSTYQSLTIWVYIDANWEVGDSIDVYGWDTVTASQIGNQIDLSDYISLTEVGSWQKASIPLGDMGLVGQTIDAIRIGYGVRSGPKVSFYLDDMQFEETGGGVEFFLRPDNATWLTIDSIKVSLIDEYDSTQINGTMPKIPYNGFLSVSTLSAGITIQTIRDGEITSSVIVKDLIDLIQLPSTSEIQSGYDGTNTWVTLRLRPSQGIMLKSNNIDFIRIRINDNLEGLKLLRFGADCYFENRNVDGTYKIESDSLL